MGVRSAGDRWIGLGDAGDMGWKGSEDGSWGGGSSWRDGWIGILRNLKARFQ